MRYRDYCNITFEQIELMKRTISFNGTRLRGWKYKSFQIHQNCICRDESNVVIACERKKKEQVDFIRCVAWNNRAKFLWEWFRKGSMIALEGMLRTRSYEKDGKRCFTMEVLAENIYFTGEKSKQYMKETEHSAIQDTAEHPEENGWSSDLDLSEFEEILSDEEVPF